MTYLQTFYLSVVLTLVFGFASIRLYKSDALTQNKVRKIARIGLLGLLGLMTLSALISDVLTIQFHWSNDRVSKQTQLSDVQLGWKKDEVLFRKGNPENTTKRDTNELLTYENGALTIFIKNDKVEWVSRSCTEYFFDNVSGMTCNADVERLGKLFDKADNVSTSKNKLEKIFCYNKYNICYVAELGKIKTFILSKENISFLSEDEIKRYDEQNKPTPAVAPAEPAKAAPEKKSSPKTQLNKDPCAPDLSKAERLERLKAYGSLRQTGSDSYSAGSHSVYFSGDTIYYCD